jgi:hypothetical protein
VTSKEARRILDAVRWNEASGIPVDTITEALETLGDLPNPMHPVAQSPQPEAKQ